MTTMHASGLNGQITVDENSLEISRKGVAAKLEHGSKGKKRIPMSSITSVQFREANAISAGYLQIGVLGGVENIRGLMGAHYDENSVTFRRSQQSDFQKIRDFVEGCLAERSKPQVIVVEAPSQVPAPPATSKLEQLKQLGELRASGVLTAEEFESEKAKILNS